MPDWRTNRDLIQKLYIVFYGRPGDPGGVRFWAEQLPDGVRPDSPEVRSLIQRFISSREARERFGDPGIEYSIARFILFGFSRDASPDEKLALRNKSIEDVIISLITTTNERDQKTLEAKVKYANAFLIMLDPNEDGIPNDDLFERSFNATYSGNRDAEVMASKLFFVTHKSSLTSSSVFKEVKDAIVRPFDQLGSLERPPQEERIKEILGEITPTQPESPEKPSKPELPPPEDSGWEPPSVDTQPPEPPRDLKLDPNDDTGLSNTDGITKKQSGLTITGTAEPGSIVNLYKNGTLLGTGRARNDGKFSIDVNLEEGTHFLTAKAVDSAGNVSQESSPLRIVVDGSLLWTRLSDVESYGVVVKGEEEGKIGLYDANGNVIEGYETSLTSEGSYTGRLTFQAMSQVTEGVVKFVDLAGNEALLCKVVLGTDEDDEIGRLGKFGENYVIFGFAGNDVLKGSRATLVGGVGDDTLIGDDTDHELFIVDSGNDEVTSIQGNDSFRVFQDASLEGKIDGNLFVPDTGFNNGSVVLRISSDAGLTVDLSNLGGERGVTVHGGEGKDFIYGTQRNDWIHAGGDDDKVNGLGGLDIIHGGKGTDELYGGSGNDRFIIETGDWGMIDVIDGEDGNEDTLVVWTSPESPLGDGNITGIERIIIEAQGDFSNLTQEQTENITIELNSGPSTIKGGSGDETFFVRAETTIIGGGGSDFVRIWTNKGTQLKVTVSEVESVLGGDGNDEIIIQGNQGVLVRGGKGIDTIQGGEGHDTFMIRPRDSEFGDSALVLIKRDGSSQGFFAKFYLITGDLRDIEIDLGLSWGPAGLKIIKNWNPGDKLWLLNFGDSGYGVVTTHDMDITNGVADNSYVILRGRFDSVNKRFIVDSSGPDSVVIYDSNGSTGYVWYEIIWIVGSILGSGDISDRPL